MHTIDSKEKDFIERVIKKYPKATIRSLDVGDHWYVTDKKTYIIERKKGTDVLNSGQLLIELIKMAWLRQMDDSISLHLCIYDNVNPDKARIFEINKRKFPNNPKFQIRNPYIQVSVNEIKHILYYTQMCGVMFHHSVNEDEYFKKIAKIFQGKYECMYSRRVNVKQLDNWENMLACFPGISEKKAVEIVKRWMYPTQYEDMYSIQQIFDDVYGTLKNGNSKMITRKFMHFWDLDYGCD